jgi:tripartite-type tricarboxylate transporter receptor subunit TctC
MSCLRDAGALITVVLLGIFAAPANAQDYPSRPVSLVIPFPAGSGLDVISRIVGEPLGKALKQPIVVDAKAGANGTIAAMAVARAAPDGHTIFMTTPTTHSANPNLLKSTAYDPLKDFTAIVRMGNLPFMLVIDPKIPVNSVQEFIAYAKANPGKLAYATSNSIALMSSSIFTRLAGLDLVHVPYRASAQAISDVVAGRIAMMFIDLAVGLPHVKAGNVRALAVTTRERSALLPDIPSTAEAGIPALDVVPWNGIFGPANIPRPIVLRLNAEFRNILGNPQIRDRLASVGFDAFSSTPEELDAVVRQELVKWANWVKEAGIEKE